MKTWSRNFIGAAAFLKGVWTAFFESAEAAQRGGFNEGYTEEHVAQ